MTGTCVDESFLPEAFGEDDVGRARFLLLALLVGAASCTPPGGGGGGGPTNTPPTADAVNTSPTTGVAPLAVSFDGAGSSDADGSVVSHQWDFGDSSAVESGVAVSHTFTTPGSYTVTLTVTDNDGGTDTDELSVSVDAPPLVAVGRRLSTAGLSNGGGSACVVNVDGTVSCWGGYFASAWTVTPVTWTVPDIADAVNVSVSEQHACALRVSGQIACWGANTYGQLGNGTTNPSFLSPVAVSGISDAVQVEVVGGKSCALHQSGTVSCWGVVGTTVSHVPTPVAGLSGATRIAVEYFHSCALVAGTVKCWGVNANGQLGDGTNLDSSTPVTVVGISDATAIGTAGWSSCAVQSGGTVSCWGSNDKGQLGDGTTTSSNVPVATSGLTGIESLDGGYKTMCATGVDGTGSCWGDNTWGALLDGSSTDSSTPVAIVGVSDAVEISTSDGFTCVLLDGPGSPVSCGGSGPAVGTREVGPFDDVVEIGFGYQHKCVRKGDGSVWCWGSNSMGQLGDGTTTTRYSPVPVPGISGAVDLAVGSNHSCAVLDTGTMKCWGDTMYGQVGSGSSGGHVISPNTVSDVTSFVSADAGENSTCGVVAGGNVYCWGANPSGLLGNGGTTFRTEPIPVIVLPTSPSPFVDVAIQGRRGCAMRSDGTVVCWGSGILGDGTANSVRSLPVAVAGLIDAVDIEVGEESSCAIRLSGGVDCWGENSSGQLGDGTTTDAVTPVSVVGLNDATGLSLEQGTSCATRSTGGVTCWGYPLKSQLGGVALPDALAVTDAIQFDLGNSGELGDTSPCAVRTGGRVSCWGSHGYFYFALNPISGLP